MMKKVFSLQELHDTPATADLIERFGKHAEFQGQIYRYTLFGWALLNKPSLATQLILDVDVNAWCRKSPGETETSLDLAMINTSAFSDVRRNLLRLLMVHCADPGNANLMTLKRNEFAHNIFDIDLLGDAQAYAKEFRAKLCAIFWVTQSIPVWRDMGEPLVERVFMSTLQIDHPEWRFG